MTKFSDSQQSQLAQIGAFLREKREQQGKSVQDIAVSTYIRPQLLNGIETGDPDLLPEPIFVQGFIRRYAETLGLKGVELSQQFTVDSIPSTPRPAHSDEIEDSSTTRLTRFAAKPVSKQPAAFPPVAAAPAPTVRPNTNPAAAAEVPIFTADKAALSDEQPDTTAPIFESDSFSSDSLALSSSTPDASEDIPIILDDSDSFAASNVFDLADDSNDVLAEPSLAESNGIGADANGLTENGSIENGRSENGSAKNGSGQMPVFETASAEFETSTDKLSKNEPSPFVSDLPLAKKTPTNKQLTTSPISYTSSEPLSSETGSADTPNLKPFAIGAVIIAALTAGIVVLANVLGGDRAPTVANSADSIESVEPTAAEPALPTLPEPEPEPAPPVSDAPLFLEVEVTAPAWTTVVADGGERLFEGTLNPGDSPLWEAQSSISVFSGNPGGLEISQNGQPAEPLGANGIPSGKDYSVQ